MRAAVPLLLLLVAAPAVGLAQDGGDDADLQRAVVLFEESETLYNAGQFEEAAALLRRAYELHPDATLLFNLARALEGMGDLDGAIDGYERYLAEADDPPDRGAVEARLDTLRVQRAALAREAESWAEEPERDGTGNAGASDDEPRVDPIPWLVLAGGVVVLGVGAGLGVAAEDLGIQAQSEPVMAEAVALHDEATALATGANALLILGGVAILAGLTWGIIALAVEGEAGDGGASAALRIGPGTVAVTGRF